MPIMLDTRARIRTGPLASRWALHPGQESSRHRPAKRSRLRHRGELFPVCRCGVGRGPCQARQRASSWRVVAVQGRLRCKVTDGGHAWQPQARQSARLPSTWRRSPTRIGTTSRSASPEIDFIACRSSVRRRHRRTPGTLGPGRPGDPDHRQDRKHGGVDNAEPSARTPMPSWWPGATSHRPT